MRLIRLLLVIISHRVTLHAACLLRATDWKMLEETQAEVPVLRPAVPFCITVQLTNQINGAQSLLEKLLVLQLVKKIPRILWNQNVD